MTDTDIYASDPVRAGPLLSTEEQGFAESGILLNALETSR
jgi:hypothetical protein